MFDFRSSPLLGGEKVHDCGTENSSLLGGEKVHDCGTENLRASLLWHQLHHVLHLVGGEEPAQVEP